MFESQNKYDQEKKTRVLTEKATYDSGQRAFVGLPRTLIIRASCQRHLYMHERTLRSSKKHKARKKKLTTEGAFVLGSGTHQPLQGKRDMGDAQKCGEDGEL